MALSCNDDTSCGRSRADRQAAAAPPAVRTHDVAGPSLVSPVVRVRWYAYLALLVIGFATGGASAWALAGVALACVATPLALATYHGSAGLRQLFFVSRAANDPATEIPLRNASGCTPNCSANRRMIGFGLDLRYRRNARALNSSGYYNRR